MIHLIDLGRIKEFVRILRVGRFAGRVIEFITF